MAGVVDLLAGGRVVVTAEVRSPPPWAREDPDRRTEVAADRERLLVLGISPTGGVAAVSAISNASGSIMPKNASADSMSSTVHRAGRSRRCRAEVIDQQNWRWPLGP
jgi:hypothetical protein